MTWGNWLSSSDHTIMSSNAGIASNFILHWVHPESDFHRWCCLSNCKGYLVGTMMPRSFSCSTCFGTLSQWNEWWTNKECVYIWEASWPRKVIPTTLVIYLYLYSLTIIQTNHHLHKPYQHTQPTNSPKHSVCSGGGGGGEQPPLTHSSCQHTHSCRERGGGEREGWGEILRV